MQINADISKIKRVLVPKGIFSSLCAKFEVSSIILTSFRQSKRNPKKLTQIKVNWFNMSRTIFRWYWFDLLFSSILIIVIFLNQTKACSKAKQWNVLKLLNRSVKSLLFAHSNNLVVTVVSSIYLGSFVFNCYLAKNCSFRKIQNASKISYFEVKKAFS